MSVHHRVWKVGADVDTDQLAPGAYMKPNTVWKA